LFIQKRIQDGPIISTGLQPGETNQNRDGAVLTAWFQSEKPLKRLSFPDDQTTGLKPGANEETDKSHLEREVELGENFAADLRTVP